MATLYHISERAILKQVTSEDELVNLPLPPKLKRDVIFSFRVHTYAIQIDEPVLVESESFSYELLRVFRKKQFIDLPEPEKRALLVESVSQYLYYLVSLNFNGFRWIRKNRILNLAQIPGVKENFLWYCRNNIKSFSIYTYEALINETNTLCCLRCSIRVKLSSPSALITLRKRVYDSDTFDCLFNNMFGKESVYFCSKCEIREACGILINYISPLHEIKLENVRCNSLFKARCLKFENEKKNLYNEYLLKNGDYENLYLDITYYDMDFLCWELLYLD